MQAQPLTGKEQDETDRQNWPRPVVHVGVTVPDIDAAVTWYATVLGFDVLMRPALVKAGEGEMGPGAAAVFGGEFKSMMIAELVAGNGVGVEFFQFLEPATPDAPTPFAWRTGFFHLCVRDPDVAGLARRIAESGGVERTSARESYPGEPYQWCVCEDPWGNMIEIYSHSHEQVFANHPH